MTQQQTNCRYYGSMRGCKYQNNCKYNHSNPNSVELCSYYNNNCQFGNQCKFRHINFNLYGEIKPHESNPTVQFQSLRTNQTTTIPTNIYNHRNIYSTGNNLSTVQSQYTTQYHQPTNDIHYITINQFPQLYSQSLTFNDNAKQTNTLQSGRQARRFKHLSNHRLVVYGYIHVIILPLLSQDNQNTIIPMELLQIIHKFYKLNYVDFILMPNKATENDHEHWYYVDENKNGIYAFGSVGSKSLSNECIELGRFMNGANNSTYVMGKNINLKYPLKTIASYLPENSIYRKQLLTFKQTYHGIFKGGGVETVRRGHADYCVYNKSLSVTIFKENIFDYDCFDNESFCSLEILLPSLPKAAKYQMVYNNFIGLFVGVGNDVEYDLDFLPDVDPESYKIGSYYQLMCDDDKINKLKWKQIKNIHNIGVCSLIMINNYEIFFCGLTMNYTYDFDFGIWKKCSSEGMWNDDDKYMMEHFDRQITHQPPLYYDENRNQVYVIIRSRTWKLKAYVIDSDIWINLPNSEIAGGKRYYCDEPLIWMMDSSGPDIVHYGWLNAPIGTDYRTRTNKIYSYNLQSKNVFTSDMDIDVVLERCGINNSMRDCHVISPPM